MYRYEIWNKSEWGKGGTSPSETSTTIDGSMDRAKFLSKNSDNLFFVLDKSQSPSKIRGFGIKGKWFDFVDNCKRCSNSGEDDNWIWGQDNTCTTCKGASWRPF